MEFQCTNCGRRLVVPDTQAGKKGRCPKCKEVLTVPSRDAEERNPLYDPRLLDLPAPKSTETTASAPVDTTEEAYEKLRGALGGRLTEPEEAPERRFPWILDVFLYPLNWSALLILLICVGTPFLLRALLTFCKALTIHVPVLLIAWVLAIVLHWAVLAVLLLYMNWYIFACIRDSAQGGIRAPETGAMTPGFGELLAEGLRAVFCILVCMAPVLVYWIRTDRIDPFFWILYGLAAFALPMALLGVVMCESIRGLNPVLIARSILRTLFHYFALAPLCHVLCLTFPLAYALILKPRYWHLSYVLQGLAFCQLMIMAHLLGRFYWKHEEKLDWSA